MNDLSEFTERLDKLSSTHKDLMDCMATLSKKVNYSEPDCYVGPFWYSAVENKCYGTVKVPVVECDEFTNSEGLHYKTARQLHKDIWKKLRTRYPNEKRYKSEYLNFPRGRVFYYLDKGIVVHVGSWIEKVPQAKQVIIEEFELPNDAKFVEDEHWDIGRGDSTDFLK